MTINTYKYNNHVLTKLQNLPVTSSGWRGLWTDLFGDPRSCRIRSYEKQPWWDTILWISMIQWMCGTTFWTIQCPNHSHPFTNSSMVPTQSNQHTASNIFKNKSHLFFLWLRSLVLNIATNCALCAVPMALVAAGQVAVASLVEKNQGFFVVQVIHRGARTSNVKRHAPFHVKCQVW